MKRRNNSSDPNHPWRRTLYPHLKSESRAMDMQEAARETFRPEPKHAIQRELLVPDGVISRELQLSHRTMEHV